MSNKKNININGSINGIANFGDNSININIKKENHTNQLVRNDLEEPNISKDENSSELKGEKFSNKFVKIIMEIVIGVIISVIAGYILYKFNMKCAFNVTKA